MWLNPFILLCPSLPSSLAHLFLPVHWTLMMNVGLYSPTTANIYFFLIFSFFSLIPHIKNILYYIYIYIERTQIQPNLKFVSKMNEIFPCLLHFFFGRKVEANHQIRQLSHNHYFTQIIYLFYNSHHIQQECKLQIITSWII